MKRKLSVGGIALALFVAEGLAQAPTFEVERLWPKPFPVAKKWILGSVSGVTVDAQDHIWVVHRGVDSLQMMEKGPALEPWASMCCYAAPQILAFDAAGNLVTNWEPKDTKGYDWPANPAGIAVDAKGNVWVAGGLATSSLAPAGRGGRGGPGGGRGEGPPPPPADAQVLKFDKTGKFVMQIGKAGQAGNNQSQTNLNRPAGVAVDDAANEVYVADGFGNRRVAVFDANTGAFKRAWGAYGEKPNPGDDVALPPYDSNAAPVRQFRTVTCVKISKDGMVYVCDRQNDRIQVFSKDGKFQKEAFVSKTTTGDGSVWDLAFSPDQKQLYVADGHDKKIWILDRASLDTVGSFGNGGRYPGQFYGVGSVAVDSKGNVYTGENLEGKRIQKFLKK
jgi:DNA-binding beta-propeller fold protein YncE